MHFSFHWTFPRDALSYCKKKQIFQEKKRKRSCCVFWTIIHWLLEMHSSISSLNIIREESMMERENRLFVSCSSLLQWLYLLCIFSKLLAYWIQLQPRRAKTERIVIRVHTDRKWRFQWKKRHSKYNLSIFIIHYHIPIHLLFSILHHSYSLQLIISVSNGHFYTDKRWFFVRVQPTRSNSPC